MEATMVASLAASASPCVYNVSRNAAVSGIAKAAPRTGFRSLSFSRGLGASSCTLRSDSKSTLSLTRPTNGRSVTAMVATAPPMEEENTGNDELSQARFEEIFDASARPPFSLQDIRNAIPAECWQKDTFKSMSYVFRDVAIVFGLAAVAASVNSWWLWPAYWFAQGTMFWALFVVGHDCGHQSFSNSKFLNDLVGHLTHSSILVPYHGWRVSHRTHHQNHGHVENDESWHPLTESHYKKLDSFGKVGRFTLPWAMFAYPFYLWSRSPGKTGSHFDPSSDLFVPSERTDVLTSTACYFGMLAILGGLTYYLGPMMMFKLYFMPYWINVIWLDVVTYLHHHGYDEKVPWYRGEEWNYMRGGLSTIDRDYGVFNNIHHDIGTHVVHHLFPQIPHYNLIAATEAVKPVMGKYYREPEKSGWFPTHLFRHLLNSFKTDRFVSDTGDVVFYQADKK
eukprot:jgi/Mesvir1/3137/Mv16308-RA.1